MGKTIRRGENEQDKIHFRNKNEERTTREEKLLKKINWNRKFGKAEKEQ